MSHFTACITNVLPDFHGCTDSDGFERQATRGEVCERCYSRIDAALQRADQLRTTLNGIDHAISTEATSNIPGPRLPLTALRLDLDELDRYQDGNNDPNAWVATEAGAAQAVRFARTVHRVDRAHPTSPTTTKLQRLRCPNCHRLAAVVTPPDWYGDHTAITCIACDWTATNPDALDIVTGIEAHGPIDLLKLATRTQRKGAA